VEGGAQEMLVPALKQVEKNQPAGGNMAKNTPDMRR